MVLTQKAQKSIYRITVIRIFPTKMPFTIITFANKNK